MQSGVYSDFEMTLKNSLLLNIKINPSCHRQGIVLVVDNWVFRKVILATNGVIVKSTRAEEDVQLWAVLKWAAHVTEQES